MRSEDILGYFIIGFILSTSYYIYRENYESFQLKCIVSSVDGNKYCVRERENIEKAADLLAKITERCKDLVAYVVDKYPNKEKFVLYRYGPIYNSDIKTSFYSKVIVRNMYRLKP